MFVAVNVGVCVGVGSSQLIPSEQNPKLNVNNVVDGSLMTDIDVPSHAQILKGMLGVTLVYDITLLQSVYSIVQGFDEPVYSSVQQTQTEQIGDVGVKVGVEVNVGVFVAVKVGVFVAVNVGVAVGVGSGL